MATQQIFGIDLGTTYSCIAYIDEHGRPVTIPNFDGDLTTPSVVYFESPSNIVVGKHAKNASKLDPDRTVSFIKRSMGDSTFAFEVFGQDYSPEAISSLVLRKLVNDAEAALGKTIKDVVITCPAYFGINQREATKNAGELAGLTVHQVLNEPTAAAIAYAMNQLDQDRVVLVYDLGGGTFDVTVIAIEAGEIRVVVTGGNHALGGKDMDDRLINHFAAQFLAAHPDATDPRDDSQSLQELAIGAEEAKKGLSVKERWPFMVSHAGRRVRVEISRETFEDLTRDLVEQTMTLTASLLSDAKDRGVSTIDEVLLVGGSSKMPIITQRLAQLVGVAPKLHDPDQAVAKGAAYMGLKLAAGQSIREIIASQRGLSAEEVDLHRVDPKTLETAAHEASSASGLRLSRTDLASLATVKIINVCSKAFGVMAMTDTQDDREEVVYLIDANTPVPVEITRTDFGTQVANQPSVHIEVMEQAGQIAHPAPENNRLIVDGELEAPAGLPAGAPIHVTFRLGEDGTLAVTAIEPRTGVKLHLSAQVEGVMSPEEVKRQKSLLLRQSVS